MRCPDCGGDTRIVDSRPFESDAVRRTRDCRSCDSRMYTMEVQSYRLQRGGGSTSRRTWRRARVRARALAAHEEIMASHARNVPNAIVHRLDGHLDVPEGIGNAEMTLTAQVEDGDLAMLHVDVHAGQDVEVPFAVGLPLSYVEVMQVTSVLNGLLRQMTSARRGGASRRQN